MKANQANRMHRLRRELVEAFINGDNERWLECAGELRRMLNAGALPADRRRAPLARPAAAATMAAKVRTPAAVAAKAER